MTAVFTASTSRESANLSAEPSCRVVHLLNIAEGGDAAIDACRTALALPAQHHVWVVGSRRDVQRCTNAGLYRVDALWSPMNLPRLLAKPLRRLLNERAQHWSTSAAASTAAPRVVLHAWTWSAAAAIARTHSTPSPNNHSIRPIRTAMLVDAPRTTSSRLIEWLHDRVHASRITSACEVSAMTPAAQAWINTQTNGATHTSIAPPIDATSGNHALYQSNANAIPAQHHTQRRPPSPDRVITLGLFGPRSSPPDARWFAFMLGLLSVGGWKLRGVVPAWANDADRARRFIRDHGYRWDLRFAEEPDRQWISECDAIVVCAQSPDEVPMFAASADHAGVPMIAVQTRQLGSTPGATRDVPSGSLDARHVAGALHRWMQGVTRPTPAPATTSPNTPLLDALAKLWRLDHEQKQH